jgi:uncharacterized protein (TIGR00251 family)
MEIRIVPIEQLGDSGVDGDALRVRIKAPPVEGKANAYLIKFLSKHWKIPRSQIEILSGETRRNKRLRILNPTAEIRVALLSFGNE